MPSSQFMSAAGTALNDLLLAQVLSAVAGIDIDILGDDITPFAGLASWATNLENQASTAINQANSAAAGVTAVQSTTTANSTAIAALTATTTASSTGGTSVSDGFVTPGLLSSYAAWTCAGSNLGSGVALTVGSAGDLGIAGSPTATGTLAALNSQTMATDDHQASIVAYSQGNIAANSMIIIRAKADWSSFVYANIYGNNGKAYIGHGSLNTSTGVWTFSDWNSGGTSIQQNAAQIWTLGAVGSLYTLYCDGTAVVAYNDTGGSAPTGAAYRSVGLGDNVNNLPVIGYVYGWQIASFSATDTVSPAYTGVGWSVYRTNTASIATNGTTSGFGTLNSGTFDTTDPSTLGASVTSAGTATIQTAGRYHVECGLGAGTLTNIGAGWYVGRGGGTPAFFRSGVTNSQGSFCCTATLTVWLNTGDTIAPGVYGNTALVGDAAGANTYFSGVLITP